MDGPRFDDLLRTVSATASRRGLLAGLASQLLAVLPSALGGDDAEATKKRKKNKKKRRSQPAPVALLPPLSPPPSGSCPLDQKPCDGGCIPSSQCCDNGDCPISGQTCSASRQCACPPALPDICGGACLASCLDPNEFLRSPDTCGCCVRNMLPSGGDVRNCCSGRENDLGGTSFCWGRQPGESCSFPEQCFHGVCLCGAFGCGCQ
jgi:hypothetical protein